MIAHHLLAGFSFFMVALLLLFAATDFGGHYFQPRLLAITHLTALGWFCALIFSLCYKLLPQFYPGFKVNTKLAWISFGLFVIGLAHLIYSFWVFEPGWPMQCAAALLLISISCLVWQIFKAGKQTVKPDIFQDFLSTSAIWLLLTVILGFLMVFNFRFAFLPMDHVVFLKLHAHAGFGGWFLLLLIAISAKSLPEYLQLKPDKTHLLHSSFYLINLALLAFFINTYLFGLNNITYVIIGLAVLGVFCWLFYLLPFVMLSVKRKVQTDGTSFLSALLLFFIALIVVPLIVYYQFREGNTAINLSVFYGFLLLLGCLGSLMQSRFFGLHFSSEKLSGPRLNELAKLRILCYLISTAVFSIGILLKNTALIHLALFAFVTSAILYLLCIFANLPAKLSHFVKQHRIQK